jgi:thioesterase domain-containing protein/acyl carrier protein
MPLTPKGKVDKRALPAPVVHRGTVRTGRDEHERAVQAAWHKVLGTTPDLDDDFFEHGGTSLLALRMLGLLETATGVRLPMRALLEAATPAQIAQRIATPHEVPAETVVPLRKGGRGLPLFLLPGGGGISVLGFRDFANQLDIDRPVYGLEVPVKGVTEQRSVEERAAEFVAEIRKVQDTGPYHLLGFSLGSWIAFEMARQLEAAGQRVDFLVVFDTHCKPQRMRSRVDDNVIRLQRYRHVVTKFMRRTTADKVKYLAVLSKSQLLGVVEKSQQRLWELRNRVQGRAAEKELDVDDIDKGARLLLRRYSESFAPDPIRAPITIILADTTSFAGVSPDRDPRLGWRHFTSGGIDVHTVPGSHLGMMLPPNLETLVKVISECVARIDAS